MCPLEVIAIDFPKSGFVYMNLHQFALRRNSSWQDVGSIIFAAQLDDPDFRLNLIKLYFVTMQQGDDIAAEGLQEMVSALQSFQGAHP